MSELPPHPISAFSLALIVLATTTMLLWPALLLNHAPLIFSDTMDYLKMVIGPERPIRPRGYSWFAATPAWIAGSLWPVVILQSLITAALVHATLRVTLPKTGLRSHFCAGLGLSAFTTAPWSASYVMPDALSAPALLGLFLILVLPNRQKLGTTLAAGVVFFATASHITHLLTALTVIGGLGLWRLAASTAIAVRPTRLILAAAVALSGFVAALTMNAAVTGHAEYARGGDVFFAARLAGDGALQRYLTDACPHPSLPRLCAMRDRLPYDADDFLWSAESPLREGGEAFNWNWEWEAELAIANPATLRAHWPIWISASLGRSFKQFILLNPGDGLDRELALAELERLAGLVSPNAAATALASRQTQEELGEHSLAAVPGPLALASLIVCIAYAVGWRRSITRSRPAVLLLVAVVVVGAVANAGAVGFGGNVHARYQSRIAWLFPLTVGIILGSGAKMMKTPAQRRSSLRR